MRLIKPILAAHGRRALLMAMENYGRPDMEPPTRFEARLRTRIGLPRMSQEDERWQRVAGTDLLAGLNLRPHLAALAEGETLIVLADGKVGTTSSTHSVLGFDVDFASGVFAIARVTAAPALPAFVVDDARSPSGVRLVVHPPLEIARTNDPDADLAANAAAFAAAFDGQARLHPHDWLWGWVRHGVFRNPQRRGRRDRAASGRSDGREARS